MAPPTRDFAKRLKAKVGKRAPSKINATDTSFKTASVAVRPQGQLSKDADSKTAAERMELASSRGNALSTLQQSLRHHAPAVRASGLKGIRDAVQSLSSLETTLGTSILEANLPSLLPNMCRCWLDEDDDVRSLAVNLFGDVLKNLSASQEQGDLKCLAPFVPFLCAYTSSALNSLDRSIRKDGALIVGMLASSEPFPSFSSLNTSSDGGMSAMAMEMGNHVDLFIPSLERLLSSMSFGGRSKNTGSNKKRKKDGNSSTSLLPSKPALAASDATLISLALLLKSSLASSSAGNNNNGLSYTGANNDGNAKQRRLDPSLFVSGECTFLRGGSAHVNSLLLLRDGKRDPNDSNSPIHSILDLPTMPTDELVDDIMEDTSDETATLEHSSSSGDSKKSTMEKAQSISSLLETLRMKFVELTHLGRQHDKEGLIMPTADLDTMDVLVQTIRFVHRRSQSYYTAEDQLESLKQTKKDPAAKREKKGKRKPKEIQDMGECLAAYRTTSKKSLSLLLETFPICAMDNTSVSRYELTNAGICSALAELGGDSNVLMGDNGGSGRESQWIKSVFSYILPRLNSTNATATEEDGDGAMENNGDSGSGGAEGIATNMLLKVVNKLLLPHGQKYLLSNPTKRHELLEAFAAAFFPRQASPSNNSESKKEKSGSSFVYTPSASAEVEQTIQQLASTTMGKTAAMLVTTLITQSADNLLDPSPDKLPEKKSLLLLQMASVLPAYLVSWEEKLPIETGLVLASLISIVRQWSEISADDGPDDSTTMVKRALNELCIGLRSSLEALYITKKKQQPSIFEKLPEQIQKLCVGLIGLLQCPSGALTRSLSTICSKSFAQDGVSVSSDVTSEEAVVVVVVRNNMANYIMEVLHSLRKTMSMSVYLSFLIDSCGIKNTTRVTDNADAAEAVFSNDRSIGLLSRFLTTSCDQASSKVLPMIHPVLQKWLAASSASTSTTNENGRIQTVQQARAAISILAAFTWDEVLCQGSLQSESDFIPPGFLKLDEKFDQLLIDCIIDQFDLSARLWSVEGGGGYMDDLVVQQQYLARLLGPITLLLRYRHGMFGQFVEGVSRRVVQQSKDGLLPSAKISNDEQQGSPSKKMNVAEILMKALLLVLKSKEPISIVELVRSSSELQNTLVSAAEDIEKSVSGGHLAHLGSKLAHQAKLCRM